MKYLQILICVGFFINTSLAHETSEYKHAVGNIGPSIGGRYCGDASQVWKIDKDGDGKMDGCIHIIYTHEKIHIRTLAITNGECRCP